MATQEAKLKAWLRKHPMPAAIMCDDKRVEVPKTGRPWIELYSTVMALAPRKLQALGPAGEVLRARELAIEDDSAETESTEVAPQSDLQLFAKLLSEAHVEGGKTVAPILTAAMTFVTSQQEHIAGLQKDNERLRQQNHRLQAELIKATAAPMGEEAGEMGLVEGLIAGMAQAAAQQAPPLPAQTRKPAPNGKG